MRIHRFALRVTSIATCLASAAAAPVRLGVRQGSTRRSAPSTPASSKGSLQPSTGAVPAWAPEKRSLPKLDDSLLSSPSLLAYMVETETSGMFRSHTHSNIRDRPSTNSTSPSTFLEYVQIGWGTWLVSGLVFLLGLIVHWFNEIRSVKMNTLLSRGLAECESIDAFKVDRETLGCLVHLQGHTFCAETIEDPQFKGAKVTNCLKLQSTVEVYEWVQTVKMTQPAPRGGAQDKKTQITYNFTKEWSTIHRNSLQFQSSASKPSPDNPRPPRGLSLGTFTTTCGNVQLGAFQLPENMVEKFTKFEPAMRYLPQTVSACGHQFVANTDGYFYARPTGRSMLRSGGPGQEPMVGDVRVRFLCVPQGPCTVVAVHAEKAGARTFVPYRAIPRGCCSNDYQDRVRLIEEGQRSWQEVRDAERDVIPCITSNRLAAGCFCCPCTTINSVCSKEVVTEEIYYISEEHDPIEKPFEWAVPRNRCRVCLFRAIGWLICYLTALEVAGSLSSQGFFKALEVFGSWTAAVFAAVVATSASAFIITIAYLNYSPMQSLKWACAMALVLALPYVLAQFTK